MSLTILMGPLPYGQFRTYAKAFKMSSLIKMQLRLHIGLAIEKLEVQLVKDGICSRFRTQWVNLNS